MNEKKLLKKIIEEYEGAGLRDSIELSDYIPERFDEIKSLRTKLRRIEVKIREESDQHKQALENFLKEKVVVQSECSHILTTFYPDASGNNDYSTVCDICDKYL